jgi:hypothetical protein
MKHIKTYKIFEADGPLEPGKWSLAKDLTIPKDIQMDIHDMSYELRDEGYTISYQWWPPYEKDSRMYRNNKYPSINIAKKSQIKQLEAEFGFKLEKIYYGHIKDFCERIKSYLDEKGYNVIIKWRKENSNEYYNLEDSIANWGPFKDYPMANSIHFRIEMISRDVYGDVNESVESIESRESKTRTKSISEDEFLEMIKKNCKNFSFMNDPLWRKSNKEFGDLGLFIEKERRQTIGNYNYKDFFDLRKDYPVPRYKSLIGSTSKEGADFFGSDSDMYMVIPFDNSQIIFAGSPDLALWSKSGQEFTDDLFIMKEYSKGFQVPVDELSLIISKSKLGSFDWIEEGFEFFITNPCLLIHESKINWLKNNI